VTLKTQSDFRHQTHCELVYRALQFHERSQFFIGVHDETLSVAMRVHNPDASALAIDCSDRAQAETGFMKIVGDDLTRLHRWRFLLSIQNRLRRGFAQLELCAHFL